MKPGDPQGPDAGKPIEKAAAAGPKPAGGITRRTAVRTGLAVLTGLPAVLPPTVSAQGAAQPGRLVLKHKDLAPKVHAHFLRMSKDREVQKAFVENPTQVILQEFVPAEHAKAVSPQRISNANRFLYAAIANEGFQKWAQDYQKQLLTKKEIDKTQVIKDFSKALAQHGSPELILSIIEEGALGRVADVVVSDNVAVVTEIAVAVVIALAAVAIPVVIAGLPGESSKYVINPSELRVLSEQMVSRAAAMQRSGQLMQVYSQR